MSEPWILCAKLLFGIILMHTRLLCVDSTAVADEVVELPGQPPVKFKQFAGYISIDEAKPRSYFYYFVEAESDSSSKPLVLWLNGGPGCSSVGEGAFVEHGPFKPSGTVLIKNDFSWNKEANMLYLETPAGVGFSYSDDKSFYSSVINDAITAGDNLAFLEKWFEKFPEYKNRDFYITGESYAGHYVPTLADRIVQSKAKINLKGIAIGNPLLDLETDFNGKGVYLWSHGLISDDTYDLLNKVCNYSTIMRQANYNTSTPECTEVANQASREIGDHFINVYDITLNICLSNVFSQSQVLDQTQGTETKVDICVEDETTAYLNRKDVQTALHARLVDGNKWAPCNDINYDMSGLEVPMAPVLASLIKSGVRVFIYSGDQDSVLPLTGTRVVVNGLVKDLGLKTTLPYSPWFNGNQVGGWTQVYGDSLSYATIRGAAHEAPFSQPERSLALFKAFLDGKTLAQANDTTKNDDVQAVKRVELR